MERETSPEANGQLPWQGIAYGAGFVLAVLLAWPIFTSLSLYWCFVLSLFYLPLGLILLHAAICCFVDLSDQWPEG